MCLIIAPGKDGTPALLPREAFNYTYQRNKDGFGAMWIEDGRVNHFKTLGLTEDEIYNTMEEYVERYPNIIFHMRLKTHGKVIPGLSHPFRILNKNRHGKDLFFMHNGVLSSFGNNLSYGQSDTTAFKDKMLVPLLTRDPDALDDPEVWDALNKLTSGSRLVFMDSDGNVKYTAENSWNDRYGLMLSNDYMIPYERKYYPPTKKDDAPSILTGTDMTVTGHFVYFRNIDRGGVAEGHWCSCPKLGFVRTEAGLLYRDNGVNVKIYHATNYIPKNEEFKHLGLQIVPPVTPPVVANDFDDDDPLFDDMPPFSVDTSEAPSSGPAPEEQRLRYARLVNNTYADTVTSRVHLLADLIGMGDKEMLSFVDEDPQNATTVLAELIEMVIEYNDALWAVDPNHPKILNADEIIRLGQADYHRDAIQEVTKIRRAAYEEQIRKVNEILDTPDEPEVNVG